jgi:uncharacterized Zn finger protein
MEKKEVKIICNECDSIQDAVVEDCWPFPIYVHRCTNCGYINMESEWNELNPLLQLGHILQNTN